MRPGLLLLPCFVLLAGTSLPAQEPEAAVPDTDARSAPALSALAVSLADAERDLESARKKLAQASTPEEKTNAEAEVSRLAAKLAALKQSLEYVATGYDAGGFDPDKEAELDLQSETRDLLVPLVQELKQLTASPREVEAQRRQIATLQRRSEQAAQAVERIESQLKNGVGPALQPRLEELRKQWEQRKSDAETELAVAEFKLDELESRRGGMFGTLKRGLSDFFRNRGRNILLSLLAGGVVFFIMRWIWKRLRRLPALQRRSRPFAIRIAEIGYHAATALFVIQAMLAVLYLAGDWLLLGLAGIFLLGIAWTGKQTIPAMYDQIKLMLNLGSVREGERVIYNGLPWEVRSVGVFTELRNPVLEGGHIRLPLRDLMPLVSRVDDDGEPWFPCQVEDWVYLSDGTHGKVVAQTPDWVQLVLLGGSRRTYPTRAFLQLCPENLANSFRVRAVFGVDYRHQALATKEVPAKLAERLETELIAMVGKENLKNLSVEFCEASSSALNYMVLADFTGEVAARHSQLSRAIPRICVDVCNANGWTIPFEQITFHQGAPAA